MSQWILRYLPEAKRELERLNRSIQPEILKGIRKVAQNPGYPGGYGKPLGNIAGTNLAGLYKIKFKKAGLHVVYGLEIRDNVMTVIIISARADNAVYEEADKRRIKYGL